MAQSFPLHPLGSNMIVSLHPGSSTPHAAPSLWPSKAVGDGPRLYMLYLLYIFVVIETNKTT